MAESDQDFVDSEGAPAELSSTPVPTFLIITYIVVLLMGILWWFLFWDGSDNTWFDRGAWTQLQQAAKTTWHSSHTPL